VMTREIFYKHDHGLGRTRSKHSLPHSLVSHTW